MSLKAAVAEAVLAPGPKCKIGLKLDELKGKARAELAEVLEGPINGAAVARGMTAEYGERFVEDAVRRHRSGRCSCGSR